MPTTTHPPEKMKKMGLLLLLSTVVVVVLVVILPSPLAALAPRFFDHFDVFNDHMFRRSLAHVIDREECNAGGSQRLHFHARLPLTLDRRFALDTIIT